MASRLSTACEFEFQHELCTLLVYYSFKPHSLDFDCFSSRWSSPTHFLIRQLASPSGALLLCSLETYFALTFLYRHHLKVRGHITVCCILCFLWMCLFIPIFRLQRIQLSDTIRCIKSCQPNDVACVLDPTHSLSHTFISLPTFREFLKPEGRYQSVLELHNICKIC